MSAWAVKDAAKSCETIFDRAWNGEPQVIMRNNAPMVVVVSFADYRGPQIAGLSPARTSAHRLIGYGRKYGAKPRTADEWLSEIREGDGV